MAALPRFSNNKSGAVSCLESMAANMYAASATLRVRGPGVSQRTPKRDDPLCRPSPEGQLQADHTGHGRRDAHRSQGIRAECRDGGTFPQTDACAAGGPARSPVIASVPRIPGGSPMNIVSDAACGKLDCMGFARNDAQLRFHPFYDRPFHFPFVRHGSRRSAVCRKPFNAIQILDRDRESLKQAKVVSGGKAGICGDGSFPRQFGTPSEIGVEPFAEFFMAANGVFRKGFGSRVPATQSLGNFSKQFVKYIVGYHLKLSAALSGDRRACACHDNPLLLKCQQASSLVLIRLTRVPFIFAGRRNRKFR